MKSVGRTVLLTTWVALALVLPCTGQQVPDLTIGAKQHPDTDAVIPRWEQSWSLDKDGAVRRRDHQWAKLLNHRAIGRFGDQRIDVRDGEETLKIVTAQTILPDGKTMPVPEYSFNLAAPDDVGAWPEYAAWQQQVLCFSGIEDNCVLELDYEIATKAGVLPWLEGDIRLNDEYPVVERIVEVSVPDGTELRYQVDGATSVEPTKTLKDGRATYRWAFKDLKPAPGEAQSVRWEKRCGRLRFTTCKGGDEWAAAMLTRAAAAVKPDEKIKKFAEAAVEQERDPLERVRKIAGKMKDSFTVVDSPKAMRSLACREAGEVLRANYGNPLEAAALCAAAIESLGMKAGVELAADAATWEANVPTLSALTGAVVLVDLPDKAVRVHPQLGVLHEPGSWGRRWLVGLDSSGSPRKTYLQGRGERQPSEIDISGKVVIDKEGKATGDLLISLTGVFYDPAALETAAAQEGLVKGMAGRVCSGATVKSHAVTTLSDEALRAKASLAWTEALKNYDKRYVLKLGDGPAFLPEVPLPLGRSERRTDVQLAGRFVEDVDLTIELPEGWTAAALPTALAEKKGAWGTARQEVSVDGRHIRFHRAINVSSETVSAVDFAGLREAVNELRTEAARMLVVTAGEVKKEKEAAKGKDKE